jgi:hypothetical protein
MGCVQSRVFRRVGVAGGSFSEADFQESKKVFRSLVKALGVDRVADATTPVWVYNGIFGHWIPTLLLGDRQDGDGRVKVLYLSPFPQGMKKHAGGRMVPDYAIWPGMSPSDVPIGDVRFAAEVPPELRQVLQGMDEFFASPKLPRDPRKTPLLGALWKLSSAAGQDKIKRKWGNERIDPPAGSTPLELPTMSAWQRARNSFFPNLGF